MSPAALGKGGHIVLSLTAQDEPRLWLQSPELAGSPWGSAAPQILPCWNLSHCGADVRSSSRRLCVSQWLSLHNEQAGSPRFQLRSETGLAGGEAPASPDWGSERGSAQGPETPSLLIAGLQPVPGTLCLTTGRKVLCGSPGASGLCRFLAPGLAGPAELAPSRGVHQPSCRVTAQHPEVSWAWPRGVVHSQYEELRAWSPTGPQQGVTAALRFALGTRALRSAPGHMLAALQPKGPAAHRRPSPLTSPRVPARMLCLAVIPAFRVEEGNCSYHKDGEPAALAQLLQLLGRERMGNASRPLPALSQLQQELRGRPHLRRPTVTCYGSQDRYKDAYVQEAMLTKARADKHVQGARPALAAVTTQDAGAQPSLCPVSCALCPVSCASCVHVLCPVPCVLCPVLCALCPVTCDLCPVPCVRFLCPVTCDLCPVPCALCPVSMSCALCPVSCALCSVPCAL
ncbi:hypothetical protein TREES_T100021447 [Tupaia chinensis]|uniref:Uncharacterized protein n=1 Tax=Tupaia chinensis TaxID=246437 RepID=L9L2V5_TUPCH|nr:hypothetical protein TREES_T100021447 [Tupaia chinensis]